ncbi:pyridoxamine 5'-phosphate oxidase family protein [Mycolicibacterium goodii]|uniref:pyridoxamine 5'-phosphate oxidase family protein n=1 Tax=Mycolicibacterium goodii TaxID=134601 RepID=UPI000C25F08B|nr:pyridoxamine 5'-phosphate oxidase family protein [Mycolicibacterium goodii]MBU8811451.1 pyridoxamine 5'-phosphate oxidase family protein [Mycolicibacterium goodii]MBU8832006.1 pyridoxamine 5'-phosphate oxidase family protein [Mycolicibacterium goodii]PJK19309.1 flavin-nucleotide-binding protein [Mycolicibacterium goodii]ULN46144.1 pyridoxamine 5'-phosphate oxidase family protein [Mycolicibacterium goodii]
MRSPSTRVTRLDEKQSTSRERLDDLLDSIPLATIALVRDGHPVAFPIGFARLGDEFVIHGSTGSPWLRALADGAAAAVSVTTLDGVVVARSSFESSFRYRSATLFGAFEVIADDAKPEYLDALTDRFIPGRTAELRASTRKELAATLALKLAIGDDNWSLKISDGWPEDADTDIAAGGWAGIVPLTMQYGTPLPAPDVEAGTPLPPSVRGMTGEPRNTRAR